MAIGSPSTSPLGFIFLGQPTFSRDAIPYLYIRDVRSPLIDLIIYFSFDLVFLVKQRQSSFVYSVKDLLNQNWTNAMFMRDKGNFWVKFFSSEKVFLWPRTIFKVIQPPANYPNLNALICCGCTLIKNVFFVLKVFLITVFFLRDQTSRSWYQESWDFISIL